MQVFDKVIDQTQSVGLPIVAVTLTAVPSANTPVLLIMHWHGFARKTAPSPASPDSSREVVVGVPGSALQLNETWLGLDDLDDAMLQAAWNMGAWELIREERRGCNTAGASEREALECRQAFAEHPFEGPEEDFMVVEAPDRRDLMRLGARMGYVRWQFRPVKNGLWSDTAMDDTLLPDGGRATDCPVRSRPTIGTRLCQTRYRLGHSSRIIIA